MCFPSEIFCAGQNATEACQILWADLVRGNVRIPGGGVGSVKDRSSKCEIAADHAKEAWYRPALLGHDPCGRVTWQSTFGGENSYRRAAARSAGPLAAHAQHSTKVGASPPPLPWAAPSCAGGTAHASEENVDCIEDDLERERNVPGAREKSVA